MAPPTRTLTQPALIAKAVAARRNHLGFKQENVPGVSRSVLSLLENGGQDRYQLHKLAAVGRAFRWPSDWVDRVEAGEDLVEYGPAPTWQTKDDPATQLAELRAEVDELKLAVGEIQGLSTPALEWLDEVAARVGVARPAALRFVL